MDWEKEVSNLSAGSEFLKLEAGKHKIKFLDEGTQKTVNYEDKELEKVFFRVEKDGKEYTWSMPKGETKMSLYGQVALCGKHYGLLTGKEITVIVQGEGKNKKYIVDEAIDIEKKVPVREEPIGQ